MAAGPLMIEVHNTGQKNIILEHWQGLIRENDIFLVSSKGHYNPMAADNDVVPGDINDLVRDLRDGNDGQFEGYDNNHYWARTNGLDNIDALLQFNEDPGLNDGIKALVLNYEPNDETFSFDVATMQGHIQTFVTNVTGHTTTSYLPIVMPTGQATAGSVNQQLDYYKDMLAEGPDTLIVQLQGRWILDKLNVTMTGDGEVAGLQQQLLDHDKWYGQITPSTIFEGNGVTPESSALQVVRQTQLGVPHVMIFWGNSGTGPDDALAWMRWHRQMIEAGGYAFTPAPMPT